MKTNHFLTILIILLLAALIGVDVARCNQLQELSELQVVVDTIQTEAIATLQKEVRILKTDLDILQNGYEEAE